MRLRTIRPRYVVFGGLVSLGCSLAISELCGQGPLHDRAPPPCVLDGPCLPNRATWGYYGPKWRRWPGTVTEPGLTPGEETRLPGTDVPAPPDGVAAASSGPRDVEALAGSPTARRHSSNTSFTSASQKSMRTGRRRGPLR